MRRAFINRIRMRYSIAKKMKISYILKEQETGLY